MPLLRLPAKLENLASVNEFLAQNVPAEFSAILPNVELVAEELLVNVFSYAYPEGSTGQAEVDIEKVEFQGQPMLRFTVKDWGTPFNPFEEAPVPDLTLDAESRPIGGLGIFLIKNVSAHQSYRFEEDANIINIFFALPGQE